MNTGDTHVIEVLDFVTHDLGGDDGFFGNRDIAGSGGDNRDLALTVFLLVLPQGDAASRIMELGCGDKNTDLFKLRLCRARRENVVFPQREPLEDRSDVGSGFALSEDDLRHADPNGAMVVNLGEAEVFEREVLELLDRIVGRDLTLFDLLEELFQLIRFHAYEPESAYHPQTVLRFGPAD